MRQDEARPGARHRSTRKDTLISQGKAGPETAIQFNGRRRTKWEKPRPKVLGRSLREERKLKVDSTIQFEMLC